MLKYTKYLTSLLGGLSYYRKYIPKITRGTCPNMALVRTGAVFGSTPEIETVVCNPLTDLALSRILVFLDQNIFEDGARSFLSYGDASTNGVGAMLEKA